jgi:hypothetical protein
MTGIYTAYFPSHANIAKSLFRNWNNELGFPSKTPVYQWCMKQFGYSPRVVATVDVTLGNNINYGFDAELKSENDAMMFRLKWC